MRQQKIEIKCQKFLAQLNISVFNWSTIFEIHSKTFYVYGLIICELMFGLDYLNFRFVVASKRRERERERKWDKNRTQGKL